MSCEFTELMAYTEAMEKLLDSIKPYRKTETLYLEHCTNRVLAEDLYAPIDLPPFDNSAMDGYAYLAKADEHDYVLEIREHILAGQHSETHLAESTCCKIMTGAPLPKGANAVVMQEHVSLDAHGRACFTQMSAGMHVRKQGEDIERGACILKQGVLLQARELALLSSLGISHVKVHQRPKIAILSTGSELQTLGNTLLAGQIYDSNRLTLKAMLNDLPFELIDLGIVKDDKAQLLKVLQQADAQADVIICSGGVSVGDADYTKDVISDMGELTFWRLAIKPGKPFAFGQLPSSYFIGLPGNPVSALVCFYHIALPLLAKLTQWQRSTPPKIKARSLNPLRKQAGRLDFQRGIATINDEGQLEVRNSGEQGSNILSSLVASNCFIVLERERTNVEKGEIVDIEFYAPPLI